MAESIVLSSGGSSATPENPLLYAGIALFVLAIGLLFAYLGAKDPLTRLRRLLGMESFDPSTIAETDGLVGASGTVREVDGTVTGPLTGEECVAYVHKHQLWKREYKYDKQTRRRKKRDDEDDWNKRVWRWSTTSSDEETIPFYLETEHGPALVDPDGADLTLPMRRDEKTSRLRRLAYSAHPLNSEFVLLRWLRKLTVLESTVPARPDRELERHVEPGDEVLVVGDGTEASGDAEAVGRLSDGTDLFQVTTRSYPRLVLGAFWKTFTGSLPLVVTLFLAAIVVYVGRLNGAY